MSKVYSLEKSPLYRLRKRKRLAEYLHLPIDYLKKQHEYSYREFSKPKPNGDGNRHFTVPSDELKEIQKQICELLKRIETPFWVMSGKDSCSYITNAEMHLKYKFVKTMDISKFYDSVQRSKIYKLFSKTFKMEHDIAWIMTELVTYKGVLPTGSPSSQLIVYWTYKNMFEEIKSISEKYNCTFSLYVDDMTFSSNNPISSKMRKEVADLLRKNGLTAKIKKDHYYQANDFKVVTGVGILQNNKVVLNDKRKKIIEMYAECKKYNNINDIEKLNGLLCSLRQIEPEIFPEIYKYIQHYDEELNDLAKKRFYRSQRKRFYEARKRVH